MDSPLLEIRNLSVSLGIRRILKDISFSIPGGKLVTIIGPNGAGKSTLIKTISGLIPYKHGEITVNGNNIKKLSPAERARVLSVVPQVRTLPAGFTGWETVLIGRAPYLNWLGKATRKDENAARAAMAFTQTDSLAHSFVESLSGGEQQRLLLARALAQDTPLILLDEPTTHLDFHYSLTFLQQIFHLVHSPSVNNPEAGDITQKGVLMVIHDLNLAARFSDCILAMDAGKIIAVGKPADILNESLLHKLYKVPLQVIHSQDTGLPVVIPTGLV